MLCCITGKIPATCFAVSGSVTYRVTLQCEEKILRVDDLPQPAKSVGDEAEASFTTYTSFGDEIAATTAQNSRHDGVNRSAVSTSTPNHMPRGTSSTFMYT